MKWLTISINPPKLNEPIVVRSKNFLGYGRSYEVLDVDTGLISQESLDSYLENSGFVEWGSLEDE